MLSRFGVTTAASGSLPTIQEQWPAGRITTGIAMPRSCMLRPRVRTSGTRNNSRRATVPRSMTAGDLTQLRTVGGHFLGLRAAALALRVLGLRAAALLRGPPLQCYVHWSLESIFSESVLLFPAFPAELALESLGLI